jgi:hypothetical protein
VVLDIRIAQDLQIAAGSGAVTETTAEGMFVRFSGLSGQLVDELARKLSPGTPGEAPGG